MCCLGRAFEAIRALQPRAKLLLVGEGPQRAALQALWPHALFVGQQRGESLATHYASADLFLFPSQTETFGNVITEAMASGLPIVAFEHAAAGQLFKAHGCGVLAPLQGEEAFVSASVALAQDAAQRRALSVAARLAAESLDWPGVVAQFEARLRQSLGEPEALSAEGPRWAQA
ncbi:MAG: glycosyltransferase [Ideonella sp.]|nr:glycosyltransferase [Ideonella sp.]